MFSKLRRFILKVMGVTKDIEEIFWIYENILSLEDYKDKGDAELSALHWGRVGLRELRNKYIK